MSDFYSAVFFDMDGLLVDSEPLWLTAETQLMANFDYQWTSEDQNQCLGGPLFRVGQYMSQRTNGKESPDYFTDNVILLMSEKFSSGAPLMPGALELLRDLHNEGVKTALVSASPRILVDAVLNRIPEHTFEFSLSADDVVNPKPNPEAYLAAAKRLNIDIENCLILEDSPNGVKAANASGAFTIAVPHFVNIESRDRVRVINSLEELTFASLQLNYEQDKLV